MTVPERPSSGNCPQLEETLAQYVELYDLAPIGFLTLDRAGTINAINLAGARVLGRDRTELVGQPLQSCLGLSGTTVTDYVEMIFAGSDRIVAEGAVTAPGCVNRYVRIEAHSSSSRQKCQAFLTDITEMWHDRLFRLQVECVADYAVCLLDAKGVVLDWNAGAERLEGYRAEEIIGKDYGCLFHDKDREEGKPAEELGKAVENGRFAEECWRLRKDGTGFWADVVLTPLRDHSGNLWGFSKVTHDITDRKKAEENLKYSDARYRILFEDNPALIMILDLEWRIVSANPIAAQHLGYRQEEILEKSALMLMHPEDSPSYEVHLQMCLADGACHGWQGRKLRKDGEAVWVEENSRLVHSLDGARNLMIVCLDVTERKKAEEERENLLVRLNAVLDSIAEGVVIADLHGKVLTMNAAALEMYQFQRLEQAQMQLREFQSLFEVYELNGPPVPLDRWPLSRAVLGEKFTDYELKLLRKDTGKSWIARFSGTPVSTKHGELILSVVTCRDITARKHDEEALLRSESKFSKIFQTAPLLIAITTLREGTILDVNDRGLATFGYEREEVLGRNFVELGVWEDWEERERAIALLEKKGSVQDLEIRFRNRFGQEIFGSFSATFIFLEDNRYVLNVVNDITDRKRMEKDILRLNQELQERAGELEAFNYTVAHDLRQPISTIASACQVIDRLFGAGLDPECLEYVSMIYKGALRMDGLIDTLLGFARMATVELERKTVDLSALAVEVSAVLQLSEPERRVEFRIAEGVNACCDPGLVRVVLENLMGNAWKYTRESDPAVIEFGTETRNDMEVFFVRDTGVGFNMADAQRLFAAFQRLPGTESKKGFGIGLATVERIVRRHGGKVWATGEPGRGATFYFTLPAPDPPCATCDALSS